MTKTNMNAKEIKELQHEFVLGTYAPELVFVKGKGCYVWDADDRKYLDFTAGIGVCNVGHCHPVITEAIQRQAAKLVHVSNLFMNDVQPQLAKVISETSFGGKVFFANSGAEANEGMIKFARKWGSARGKSEIICMRGSFHGRTLATLAATDNPKFREGFAPHVSGFCHVPLNDLGALEQAVDEKTTAVLIEPIQGEGGIFPAETEFLSGAREICDTHELLLLFDEVQCGMGRTGHYFAYQHFGVEPDAMSLAKALGNGFPIGAFEVQKKWADVLKTGSHASTFGGTALACSAALATFSVIDSEDILFHCQKMGEYLKGRIVELSLKSKSIKDVRGIGLMIGIECEDPVDSIVKEARNHGLLILTAGKRTLRLLPPLVVGKDEIDKGMAILEAQLLSQQ